MEQGTESEHRHGAGRGRILLVAVIVVAMVGAGALTWSLVRDDGADADSDPSDLAHRVAQHGDVSRGIVVIDLAGARESLDLPDDADPFDLGGVSLSSSSSRCW